MRRRLFCVLLACLVLSGCSQVTVFEPVLSSEAGESLQEEILSPEVLRLPVNATDSLNPYSLVSQANRSAIALLYDGLFALTPEYGIEARIASSASMEGGTWRVLLRSGVLFSDGSAVTAQDVFYSFQLAYAESSPYRAHLRQVQSCTVQDNAVIFTLTQPNSLFCNTLTFPIVKNGTGGADIPVGSGRFSVASSDSSGIMLVPGREAARCGPIRAVQLVALDDDATLASSLKVGVIDMMQTTQSTRDELLSGVSSQSLDINTLGYLAINRSGVLSGAAVRRAIYLAINREELAQWSYGSKAEAAYTPFNPLVNWLPDAEFVGRDGLARAMTILDEAGFLAEEGSIRGNEEGEELRMELLVNSDNEIRTAAAQRLSDQLARAGIAVTVVGKPYESYIEDYNAGRYDLCLAEMQLGDDMNLDLVLPGISSFYGNLSTRYTAFLADIDGVDPFLAEFMEENPFIPLIYRHGTVASSRNFRAYIVATKWDIFYNMADW